MNYIEKIIEVLGEKITRLEIELKYKNLTIESLQNEIEKNKKDGKENINNGK